MKIFRFMLSTLAIVLEEMLFCLLDKGTNDASLETSFANDKCVSCLRQYCFECKTEKNVSLSRDLAYLTVKIVLKIMKYSAHFLYQQLMETTALILLKQFIKHLTCSVNSFAQVTKVISTAITFQFQDDKNIQRHLT